ncbi:MAG: DUF3800 domain-containing protein [Butyrivibrio sp.]|uniref:DUF3800 domain-containing protein n=1 Tax=Butyrivibrio sp. TaxID=28121 RepID=UPI0025F7DC2A|nr:DUF3800 domain-containing protein [Butyrivibrio sp.]MCR5772596.1 DUF3800 domain-containing protein [Butyrivibrio sp.]
MKELSIFIDESGDFGEYSSHSPYYIITMVFHDQSVDISNDIAKLDTELDYLGLHDLCIHTGPIIRKEEIYKDMTLAERRRIFNKMVAFVRQLDIYYKSFYIEKKHVNDPVEAAGKLAKQIASFIRGHYNDFLASDDVKIYYDNGQVQVSKILASVFSVLLPNPIYRKVLPKDYKLFQVADLLCTFTLIDLKINDNLYSKSEEYFFGNRRDFKKNYLKKLQKKEWL